MSVFLAALANAAADALPAVSDAAGELLATRGFTVESLFTKGIRTAYPYMLSGVSQGLSANAILSALSDAGIGVRRKAGLATIGLLRNSYGLPQWVRGQMAANYPGADLFRVGGPWQAKNYRFVFELKNPKRVKNGRYPNAITLTSDSLLTNDELSAYVDGVVTGQQYGPFTASPQYDLVQAYVNPNATI